MQDNLFELANSLWCLDEEANGVDEVDKEGMDKQTSDDEFVDITDGMISFSLLPKSRWQNLLSLEAIKVHALAIILG